MRIAALIRRRLLPAFGIAGLFVLVAHPAALAASDVFSNVGPASQVPGGSLMNAYPLSHYALDIHFKAVEAGVFDGVDVSGLAPTIAWFLASLLWELTAFVAKTTITLFTFAFSLDLIGSQRSGGAGALAPVSEAVRSMYRTVFGGPWLSAAVVLTGIWAMWQALVRRRYTETAGALGMSLVFLVVALAFVTQPERTIGQASKWTNDLSGAFLSLSSEGGVGNRERAKREAADQLFALLVYDPWVVLQFGGLEHCVKTNTDSDDPVAVPVRPLSSNPAHDAALARRLGQVEQISADGKTCVNNRNKYANRFLAHPPGSDERDDHYDALREGDTGKAPESDRDGYRLSTVDKPAADAMGKGGQYQRLLMAIVVFAGELGAFVLLGSLSVAVVLVQVLVLLLLAFAPVALVAGVIPGRGHDFFKSWLARLGAFLARKAIYSLILAVLLAVASAVGDATSNLGWLMAFGLQGAFFWTVFLFRRQLVGQATHVLTGRPATDAASGTLRLASVAAAAHMATRIASRARGPRRHSGADGGRVSQPAVSPPAPDPATRPAEAAAVRDRDDSQRQPDTPPAAPPTADAPDFPGGPDPDERPRGADRTGVDEPPATAADLDREIDQPPRRDPANPTDSPTSDPNQQTTAPAIPPVRDTARQPAATPPRDDPAGEQDRKAESPLARDLRDDADRLATATRAETPAADPQAPPVEQPAPRTPLLNRPPNRSDAPPHRRDDGGEES